MENNEILMEEEEKQRRLQAQQRSADKRRRIEEERKLQEKQRKASQERMAMEKQRRVEERERKAEERRRAEAVEAVLQKERKELLNRVQPTQPDQLQKTQGEVHVTELPVSPKQQSVKRCHPSTDTISQELPKRRRFVNSVYSAIQKGWSVLSDNSSLVITALAIASALFTSS